MLRCTLHFVRGNEDRAAVVAAPGQLDRVVNGRRFVNAGSVGRPYEHEPGAYWALLGPDVELRRTEYDVEQAAATARALAYPDPEFAQTLLTPPSPEQRAGELEQRAGEQQADPVRIRAADGETRWVAVSRAPLPEGGSVLVLRDDTTRRQLDEMLAQQKQERLRADLVAAVSHELRTPLTSILGFTQTLLHQEVDEEARRRYLRIMEKAGERLRELIDDLLDLRQIEEGRFRVEPARLDLGEVLAEQVEVAAAQSEEHTLVLDLPPHPLPVRGERQRLGQVVANLISNAIKYSPNGDDIHVSAVAADDRVRVFVRDSGIGIPAEQQPFIFTRFFRVESPDTREIGGTGLGLTLSREIVEAHGGQIGFDSTEGEGSTFYFDVPRA